MRSLLALPPVTLLAGLLAAGCSAGPTSATQPSAPAASGTAASAPSSAPASPPASPAPTGTGTGTGTGATVTAELPVVDCPTTIAIARPPPPVALPRTEAVAVPPATAGGLSVYADDQDTMRLLGPRGWDCAASYGADGSGGVVVYPPGESVPQTWGAGWQLPRGSTVTAVAGRETSACYTCALGQACPLFASAAGTFRSYLGHACPARPAAEAVAFVTSGIASFADPPGVGGDGVPSGGAYPASGVVTYYPNAKDGSWAATCTLPPGDKDECTAALNAFIARYGTR